MVYQLFFDYHRDEYTDFDAHQAFISAVGKYADGMWTTHLDGTSSMIVDDFNILNAVRELKWGGIKLISFTRF